MSRAVESVSPGKFPASFKTPGARKSRYLHWARCFFCVASHTRPKQSSIFHTFPGSATTKYGSTHSLYSTMITTENKHLLEKTTNIGEGMNLPMEFHQHHHLREDQHHRLPILPPAFIIGSSSPLKRPLPPPPPLLPNPNNQSFHRHHPSAQHDTRRHNSNNATLQRATQEAVGRK